MNRIVPGLLLLFVLAPFAFTQNSQSRAPQASSNAAQMPVLNPATAVAMIERLELQEAKVALRERAGWSQPRRIGLVSTPIIRFTETQRQHYQQVAGNVEVIVVDGLSDPGIASIDGAIGYCTPELLGAAPQLRWLHNLGAGMDRCSFMSDFAKLKVIITNGQRTSGPTIAEHAIAMMMMLTRGLNYFHGNQANGVWVRQLPEGRRIIDVEGKTLLVAGLGGVGTEIARRGAGLGMRVIATRNSSRTGPPYVAYVGLSDELLKLAAQADVIINALPLTPATQGVFNNAFFDAVPRGAFFINIARGQTTDTNALVAALKDGRLAGAGLDALDPEPLPPTHELWRLPNVVISPHVSSATSESGSRQWLVSLENLRRYVSGERLLSVVDLAAGY